MGTEPMTPAPTDTKARTNEGGGTSRHRLRRAEEPCVASSILALGTVRGFLVIQENPAPRKSASNTVKPLCYRQTGIGIGGRSSIRCGRRGHDLSRRGHEFECDEWPRERPACGERGSSIVPSRVLHNESVWSTRS